jgi:pimeloyl-ACP methyl ester carboxylesterase
MSSLTFGPFQRSTPPVGLARVAVDSLRRNDAAATYHLRSSLRSGSRRPSAPLHDGVLGVTVLTRAGTLQRDDGPTIAYDVVGHGPLVVFVHGLTSFRQTWDPVTTLLAEEFTCVRLDLRGHGASSHAADYSMVSLVGDVRAVVEEVALGEPAIVGHSLGASIAAVCAATHGVRAVVCVEGSLRFGEFARLVQAHAEDLRSQRTMKAVLSIDRALELEPYTGVQDIEDRVLAFPREVVLGIWDALLITPPEQLTAIAKTILPQITAPLLSLHGSPPPPDYAAWLTGLARGARVETWDGTGHMLHLVDPERFAARVRPLLEDPPAP